jgi:hypothetical protein
MGLEAGEEIEEVFLHNTNSLKNNNALNIECYMHVMGEACVKCSTELHKLDKGIVLRTVRPDKITVRITGYPWPCYRKARVVANHTCYACKRAACNPISSRHWPGSPPTHAKFWAAVLIQVRGNSLQHHPPRPPAACLLPYPLSTLQTSVKNNLQSTPHAECPLLSPRPLQHPVRFIRCFDSFSASRRAPRAGRKTTPPRSRFRTNPVRRA